MRLAPLAFACVIGGSGGVARASCGGTPITFGPAPGSLVPARPHLFVFVPRYEAGGTFSSPTSELVVRQIAESPAYRVHEVIVLADRGIVTLRYQHPRFAEDVESASWLVGAPPDDHATVTGVAHDFDRWMCSWTNAIRIAVAGTAVAVRFDWIGAPPTVLPADDVLLGHVSCTGYTAIVDDVRDFDLVALFADGREQRLGHARARIDDLAVRLPTELVGGDDDGQTLIFPFIELRDRRPWWTPGRLAEDLLP